MKRLVAAASPELFQVAQPPLALNSSMGVSATRGGAAALATALTASRPNTSAAAAGGCCGKKTWAGSGLGLKASPALSGYGLGLPAKSNCGCAGGAPGSPFTGLGVSEPGPSLKATSLGAKRVVAESDVAGVGLPVTSGGSGKDRVWAQGLLKDAYGDASVVGVVPEWSLKATSLGAKRLVAGSDLAGVGLPVTSGGSGKDRVWAQGLLKDAYGDASVVGVVPEWSLAPKPLGPLGLWELRGATEDFLGGKGVVRGGGRILADRVVESRLLSLIVQFAREMPGSSEAEVWRLTWFERERSGRAGDVETAIPPGPGLLRTIIEVARRGPVESRLPPFEVLRQAVQEYNYSVRLAKFGAAWETLASAVASPFGGSSTHPTSSIDDSFAIDSELYKEIVREALKLGSMPEVFARALERRSTYLPWPIAMPEREYAAAIITAARTHTWHRGAVRDAIVSNRAKADYLFALLGGSLLPTDSWSHYLEIPLRDLIVDSARGLRPSNWLTLVREGTAQLQAEKKGKGSNHRLLDELLPPEWRSPLRRMRDALETAADLAWDWGLARRDARWELPWPPRPVPNRRLLMGLIGASWSYPEQENEDLLEIALRVTGRFKGGLGVIRQGEAVSGTAIAIGTVLFLGLGTAILGAKWCFSGGCVDAWETLERAVEDEPSGDPPLPVQGGANPGASAGGKTNSPDPIKPDPCNNMKATSPRCGTVAAREKRATTATKALDSIARSLWDQMSPEPTLPGAKVSDVEHQEHSAAIIRRKDGTLRLGQIVVGMAEHVDFDLYRAEGEMLVGLIHTHPSDGPDPSTTDTALARKLKVPSYILVQPESKGGAPTLKVFEPAIGEPRGTLTDVP